MASAPIISQEILASAKDLTGLIGYQSGSVVSKTLLDRSIGTITLFSFDQGQGLSEHTAPFEATVQVLDGKAEITIAGVPHVVSAGQIIIMPAQQPHARRALTPFKMLLTMIRA